MKILFVTDRNLIHDIRVFREIKLATSKGHTVDYIAVHDSSWSQSVEEKHKKASGARHGFYLNTDGALKSYYKLIYRLAKLSYPFAKNNIKIAALSTNSLTAALIQKLDTLKEKYDFVVAHGYRTLYPVFRYAEKNSISFGFDAASFIFEPDFAEDDKNETERRVLLLKKLLPKARYFTYTYKPIGQRIKEILGNENIPENFELLNSYYDHLFQLHQNSDTKLNFVWIAKKIDLRSGLMLVLPALEGFSDKIRLHIFGQATNDFFAKVYEHYKDFIVLHPPLTLDELSKAVCKMDVGLSILLPYLSPALDFTLTNKVFLYAQAGLYTIASKTKAQEEFFSKYNNLGTICDSNLEALIETVETVLKNKDKIRAEKAQRFEHSKIFAWDKEQKKLAEIFEKINSEVNA